MFDYISNNVLMPVLAAGTCILIGFIAKPKTIIEEATKNGEKFTRKLIFTLLWLNLLLLSCFWYCF